jgi:predicted enzyme related to lactoylglutathione lyase
MPRVVHFEWPADDPKRAVTFYKEVFGWKIENYGGPMDYWLITTGPENEPGIDGAIACRGEMVTGGTLTTIDVSSVDEYIRKITVAGGKVIRPKTPIPGIGYHAYCQDTEGTIFGIMEADETAR